MSPSHHNGVTLIEMLIAICVAAIVLLIGVPSFNMFIRDSQATTETNTVIGSLNLARSEAIKRGAVIRISPNSGTDWTSGWRIWQDNDGNGIFNEHDEVIRNFAPLHSDLSTDIASLAFDNKGWLLDSSTPRMNIQPSNCQNDERRQLVIGVTGRVTLHHLQCS